MYIDFTGVRITGIQSDYSYSTSWYSQVSHCSSSRSECIIRKLVVYTITCIVCNYEIVAEFSNFSNPRTPADSSGEGGGAGGDARAQQGGSAAVAVVWRRF